MIQLLIQLLIALPEGRLLPQCKHIPSVVLKIVALRLSAPVKEIQKPPPVPRLYMKALASLLPVELQVVPPY